MRRMSQWMFCAKSSEVDVLAGRMIQRITFEITRGLVGDEERVCRNWGIGVFRERRWSVQIGILDC
jgi:hypothetical protein